jgi:hypothetical protein
MAMKWIPLDGKKEPPFEKKLIVGVEDAWDEAYLEKIETRTLRKEYTFRKGEHEITGVTHYMLIDPIPNKDAKNLEQS